MADNNLINGSSYDLQEKWLTKIAPKYFEGVDIGTLRLGLFGYLNEVMGSSLEDLYYYNNVLSDETFLSLATMPKSIYEYASRYKLDSLNASPSIMNFTVFIRIDDLIKVSEFISKDKTQKQLVISKNTSFIVDGKIPFMLDYPIIVNIKKIESSIVNPINSTMNSSNVSITCKYDLSDNNELSDIVNPYIKCIKTEYDGYSCIVLSIAGRQLTRSVSTFNVFTDDIADLINFEVPYTNQLAGFNVLYTPSGDDTVKLPKFFNGNKLGSEEEQFCYYQYNDETTLQIFFSGIPGDFRPEYNSTLNVEVFTTLGKDGNFEYDGKYIEVEHPKDEIRNYQLSDLHITVIPAGQPAIGGVDKPSLEEIKKMAIEESSIRGNIVTEPDLNTFFNKLISKYSNNGSMIKFYKNRDDILRRLYSAFVIMFDENNQIIPSNTVNLSIDENTIKKLPHNYIYNTITGRDELEYFNIPSSSVFELKPEDNIGNIINYNLTSLCTDNIDELNDSIAYYDTTKTLPSGINPVVSSKMYFSNPFLMNITFNDHVQSVNYYMNNINKETLLMYSEVNNSIPDEFIINKIAYNREPSMVINPHTSYINIKNIPNTNSINDINIAFTGLMLLDNLTEIKLSILNDNLDELKDKKFNFIFKFIDYKNNDISFDLFAKDISITSKDIVLTEFKDKDDNSFILNEDSQNRDYYVNMSIYGENLSNTELQFNKLEIVCDHNINEYYDDSKFSSVNTKLITDIKSLNEITINNNFEIVNIMCSSYNFSFNLSTTLNYSQLLVVQTEYEKSLNSMKELLRTKLKDESDPSSYYTLDDFLNKGIDTNIFKNQPDEIEKTREFNYLSNIILKYLNSSEKTGVYASSVLRDCNNKIILRKYQDPNTGIRKDKITLKGMFENIKNNQHIGYMDINLIDYNESENYYTYKSTIYTNDTFDTSANKDDLILINSLYNYIPASSDDEDNTFSTTLSDKSTLPAENLNLMIGLLYLNEEDNVTDLSKTFENINSDGRYNNYITTNIYTTIDNIILYSNINYLIHSTIEQTNIGKNEVPNYSITSIPLISNNFFNRKGPDYKNYINTTLEAYLKLLKDNLSKVENNFDIDFKFFNSYGPVKSIYTNEGLNTISIRRSSIQLSFNIKLENGSTIDDDVLNNFIISYVQNCNTEQGINFYIFNLINALKKEFDNIIYVQFNGMNDLVKINTESTAYQNIQSRSSNELENDTDFIPEYLNVASVYDAKSNKVKPQIKIVYI